MVTPQTITWFKKEQDAIKLLIAHAVCCSTKLHCSNCPFYSDKEEQNCADIITESKLDEAVQLLNKSRYING